jgi:hypothetical protein
VRGKAGQHDAVTPRIYAGLARRLARRQGAGDCLATKSASIRDFGARPDGATLATSAIQAGIDHLAQQGGGTLTIPPGTYLSGALFMKPGVHLHLERGSVLKCTTDMVHFPRQRTRIEGHVEEHFTPALINADRCDGLRITGEGVLDGSGMAIWERFWALRKQAADPGNFPNVGLDRARLALIQHSRDVLIEGITFKDRNSGTCTSTPAARWRCATPASSCPTITFRRPAATASMSTVVRMC